MERAVTDEQIRALKRGQRITVVTHAGYARPDGRGWSKQQQPGYTDNLGLRRREVVVRETWKQPFPPFAEQLVVAVRPRARQTQRIPFDDILAIE